MKKLLILALTLLSLYRLNGQVTAKSKIKILLQDTTRLISGTDTSYLYDAFIVTGPLNGISSATLVCKAYNAATAQWVVEKDTTYTWSVVTATTHNNQRFKICRPNANMLKLCVGRLGDSTRKKFIFTVTGSNGILTKEFDF